MSSSGSVKSITCRLSEVSNEEEVGMSNNSVRRVSSYATYLVYVVKFRISCSPAFHLSTLASNLNCKDNPEEDILVAKYSLFLVRMLL